MFVTLGSLSVPVCGLSEVPRGPNLSTKMRHFEGSRGAQFEGPGRTQFEGPGRASLRDQGVDDQEKERIVIAISGLIEARI